MTAPSAPVIVAHSDGGHVYLRWQPVLNAATYNVYSGSATNPSAVKGTVAAASVGTDGWFHYVFAIEEVPTYVNVTAVNAGAEESADSNEYHLGSYGVGASFPPGPPRGPYNANPFG